MFPSFILFGVIAKKTNDNFRNFLITVKATDSVSLIMSAMPIACQH